MFLNLKPFNRYIAYHRFKMEYINHVVDIIKPNIHTHSMDIFYSKPIYSKQQNLLKFMRFPNYIYCICLPNRYGPAILTRDSYLQGNIYELCI